MSNAVDIYLLDLDRADGDLNRLWTLLDVGETERANRYRFEIDRKRYIARRGQLRELLSQYLGLPPREIRLVTNEFGKPFIKNGDLQFNASHSVNLGLVVIARGREVGCDIEWRDPSFPSEQIARGFFSPAEARALAELDGAQQLEAFYNCWTRKEAYIKARGYGVSLPLDSFEVSLLPGQPAALLKGCDGWSVQSFEPRAGFQAAIVAEGSSWDMRFGGGDFSSAVLSATLPTRTSDNRVTDFGRNPFAEDHGCNNHQ